MKKSSIKRAAAVAFSCVALTAALWGCSSTSDSTDTDSASTDTTEATDSAEATEAADSSDAVAAEASSDGIDLSKAQGGTAKKVYEAGVVNVGTGNNNPPMNYLDDDDNWVGFDIDLAQALADEMGVDMQLVEVNNDTRISYLGNGTIDMTVSNLSHTIDRENQIDFAEPSYIWDGKVAFVRKGEFTDMMDLAGKKIAVDQGSSAYKAVEEYITSNGGEAPEIEEYQGNAACFQALKDGKVDAFTQDSLICQGIAGDEASDYEVLGSFYSGSLYGIGVPSNDSEWRDDVSIALQNLMSDGTYDEIYDKWFGEDGLYPLDYSVKPVLSEEFGDHVLYTWPD